ncbi:iron chelate uptake ABC transporter family permease subunit [Myroides sp. 1354]|uniref:ABC transporter permease n=1 Tax=unclassified Myroides TaxID=2642485 RepID=UPI002576774E|nr:MULTISPECIES: iron chelate uptake ABC transporter family permease subunit [unclassified Myroides]MDM1044900.1 iron chelate uptake ABC transporter family permease subunit [Myroides sp. R163-1]MDM1055613.1 iron chelate uptake ABC transporter family permease subunit [Myroides sp. 1354]MDM1068910.1 iron chelate uptake ABC transporter family permease subunit [Myroides sp. 1372]
MLRIVLVLILLLLSVLSIFVGVKDISIFDLHRLTHDELLVIFVSRVPRTIAVLIAGVGMSISGLIVQQISLNKFVSPTTMGTLDACKMGILFSMILFPNGGIVFKTLLSFTIALLASIVFLRLASKIKVQNVIFIPLIGIVFGNILSAIATFFAFRYNLVQNMDGWMMGDFSSILKGNYEILYLGVLVVILCYLYANKFTIVGLGEDAATSLGLNPKRIMYLGLVFVSITSTVVVLTAGVIPFLGLIVPNIVSLIFGDNLRKTISYTALVGAIFLLVCDLLSRIIIAPYEVPIGLTVSIVGGIVFLYLILKKTKHA